VLGVCRRVLGDAHEAEDAAQATFLALARKAGSIGRRQAVAAWLYKVAYRAALQARSRTARRIPCDPRDLNSLPARTEEDPVWRDLRPVLDDEVSRLPDRYRAVFVLCHVAGRTNEEAAREVGCPVGTVLSRLARARQRLRDRLTRRGVTLGAGILAVAWAEDAAAAVPGVVVRVSVRGAALATAGKGLAGVISTEAAALAEGVVKAMLLTKVKVGVVLVLTAALLGGGGGLLSYRTTAGEPAASNRLTPTAADDEPAVAEARRLKDLLAAKEKEVRKLQDRLAQLEELFKTDRARLVTRLQELEARARSLEDQAERARAAEMEARKLTDKRAVETEAARRAETPFGGGGPPVDPSHAEKVEQAREEVEILEAQLEVKRAYHDAARDAVQGLEANMGRMRDPETQAKLMMDRATLRGQWAVKGAELKEAQVRLAQAKRRLERLQNSGPSAEAPHRRQVEQRAAELERKLDALTKELEALRRELKAPAPTRP
jgi:RNA polymerase sigma factor (sigma-70 family)